MLETFVFVVFSNAHMLSVYGRCKTFDASADGYVRGEGAGALVIDARTADAAPLQFAGSAVNQDGRSATLTAPNGPQQQAVIREAQRDARITPQDMDIFECHGSGTALGDPIEVGSLRNV
jgi:acyl transferase domain-containing protein